MQRVSPPPPTHTSFACLLACLLTCLSDTSLPTLPYLPTSYIPEREESTATATACLLPLFPLRPFSSLGLFSGLSFVPAMMILTALRFASVDVDVDIDVDVIYIYTCLYKIS